MGFYYKGDYIDHDRDYFDSSDYDDPDEFIVDFYAFHYEVAEDLTPRVSLNFDCRHLIKERIEDEWKDEEILLKVDLSGDNLETEIDLALDKIKDDYGFGIDDDNSDDIVTEFDAEEYREFYDGVMDRLRTSTYEELKREISDISVSNIVCLKAVGEADADMSLNVEIYNVPGEEFWYPRMAVKVRDGVVEPVFPSDFRFDAAKVKEELNSPFYKKQIKREIDDKLKPMAGREKNELKFVEKMKNIAENIAKAVIVKINDVECAANASFSVSVTVNYLGEKTEARLLSDRFGVIEKTREGREKLYGNIDYCGWALVDKKVSEALQADSKFRKLVSDLERDLTVTVDCYRAQGFNYDSFVCGYGSFEICLTDGMGIKHCQQYTSRNEVFNEQMPGFSQLGKDDLDKIIERTLDMARPQLENFEKTLDDRFPDKKIFHFKPDGSVESEFVHVFTRLDKDQVYERKLVREYGGFHDRKTDLWAATKDDARYMTEKTGIKFYADKECREQYSPPRARENETERKQAKAVRR